MEFVTTVLIGIVLYLIYYIAYLNENYWKNLGVPILKDPKPFFGNAKNLFGQKKSFTEHLHDMYNEFTTEKYFGMLSFRCPIFVPRDPELINTILIKNFNNFHDRFSPRHGSDLVCDAIIHVPGERWRNLRYKLTPAFTSGKLKMMFNDIKECTDEVVTYLKSHQSEDIEGKDLMFKFIINVVGSVAFGLKVDSLNEGGEIAERFLEATNNFFSPNPKMMLKSLISMICPKIDSLVKFNLIEPEQNKFFNDLINGIIKQREKSGVRRNDFLQILIDNRQKEQHNIHDHIEVEEPEDSVLINQLKHMKSVSKDSSATNQDVFTDECIASQTFTFISGGSETTSTILSFALYELALNQVIQKKLQNEIDTVIKANGLHYDTLRKFTYMDQVLQEVLRKYPTLGAVMRVCTEDFKIPNTNITIEKDTIVSIPVMGLHKDPQYFPEPEKFNPDRFKDMDAIPKGAYLPFGAGPRMCIAVRLAMVEMKICLAMLLSNFNLTLSKKTSVPLEMVKQSIVLKPERGVWVQFSERK